MMHPRSGRDEKQRAVCRVAVAPISSLNIRVTIGAEGVIHGSLFTNDSAPPGLTPRPCCWNTMIGQNLPEGLSTSLNA